MNVNAAIMRQTWCAASGTAPRVPATNVAIVNAPHLQARMPRRRATPVETVASEFANPHDGSRQEKRLQLIPRKHDCRASIT
jgi:hypothetical protein